MGVAYWIVDLANQRVLDLGKNELGRWLLCEITDWPFTSDDVESKLGELHDYGAEPDDLDVAALREWLCPSSRCEIELDCNDYGERWEDYSQPNRLKIGWTLQSIDDLLDHGNP